MTLHEPYIVGREAERERLRRAAEQGGLVTLVGPPGVGKSALARAFARQVSVDYVGLDGARDVAGLAAAIERSLGAHGDRPEALAFALARRRRTVVFDDADDVRAPLGDLVTRWLALAPGSACVVTSVRRLGLERERLMRLEPFRAPPEDEDDDAVRLFRSELERRLMGRPAPATFEAVARVVSRVEGLPLAILRAAALASVVGVEAVERLLESDALLDAPSDERLSRSRHHTLRQAFDALWRTAETTELRRHAAALALLSPPFSLESAAAITGAEPLAAVELLRQLEERSLVLADGASPPGFQLFGPVRARARDLPDFGRAAATRRMVDFFAGRVDGSHASGVRLTEVAGAREHDSARAALEHALALRRYDQAALIAIGLGPRHLSRGPLDEYARVLGDLGRRWKKLPRARAGALALLEGLALLFSGQREQSILPFGRAARLAAPADRLTAESYLGLVHGLGGDFRRARRHLTRARAAGGARLEPDVEARILKNAANVLAEEGGKDALEVIARACACFRRAGDVRGEGFMLLLRASVWVDHGQLEHAGEAAREAIELLARAGDVRSLAWADCILATVDRDSGRPELAREGYQRAAQGLRGVGDEQTRGIVLEMWATLELSQQAALTAVELCREASVLLERAGDHEHLAMTSALLGAAYAMQGQLEMAEAELARARQILPRRGRAARRWALRLLGLATATPEEREAALALPAADSEETRSALRVLAAVGHRTLPPPEEKVLHVATDASWLVGPEGTRLDLRTRPVARRLMEILIQSRERAPGTSLPATRLIKHAWPNQQIRGEAASNRLYVALSRLRRMGLESAIESGPDGYRIDRRISVVRVPVVSSSR